MPFLVSTVQLTLDFLVVDQEGTGEASGRAPEEEAPAFVRMEGLRGFADRISIVAGRAASPDDAGGEIEAVISEQAQQVLGLYLDRVYDVWDTFYGTGRLARVRIVGVYTVKDPQDPFWFRGLGEFEKSLMVDADLLERRFVAANSPNFSSARWFFALDYHAIRIGDVPSIVARIKDFQPARRAAADGLGPPDPRPAGPVHVPRLGAAAHPLVPRGAGAAHARVLHLHGLAAHHRGTTRTRSRS